ncbi:MAG: LptF/LptG family permease, partial [Phycisphaerae bacterium]|nr:LptF/LptG family permease [Phycisphaerae bacterium]
MKVLDRYILRNFLVSYLILGFVLIGLYVVADLAMNSDEFTKKTRDTQREQTAGEVLSGIGNYYGHQVFVYFRDLAGIITLASANVTLITMNRRNEMTALLASGVSLYRIIWPIVLLGLGFNLLAVMDQELILPRMADELVRKHDEQAALREYPIWSCKLVGAWSTDDRAVVGAVAPVAGDPKAVVLRLSPETSEAAPMGVRAIRQMRNGDLLAVHDGRSDAVRLYVRVQGLSLADLPAGVPLDSVTVTAAGVEQGATEALPAAGDPNLGAIRAGDLVAPAQPPQYYATALKFVPEGGYAMENVVIVKRHALPSAEPLARLNCRSATWSAKDNAWRLDHPSLVFLTPSSDSQGYIPPAPEHVESALVYSLLTPREIALRNSSQRWMQFMSTSDLREFSRTRDQNSSHNARSLMHIRFTQPVINMILLLLGVPFALTRAPVNLLQNMLKCVLSAGVCFVSAFVCQQVSSDARAWAVVAAWLPVIIFG